MNKEFKRFEVGRSYSMSSPCDHECVWMYEVVARMRCTITIVSHRGVRQVCRVKNSEVLRAECCQPLGSYSMSPILCAE